MSVSAKASFLRSEFRDLRLVKRYTRSVELLSNAPGGSIAQAACDKAATKGVYRFLHNPKVTAQAIIQSSAVDIEEQLLQQAECTAPLLCLSDSTELDYTGCRSGKKLGPLTYRNRRGMILHNSLLVRSSGAPIGMLTQKYIIRKDEHFGKKKRNKRAHAPIAQKESQKWLDHFLSAQQLSCAVQRPIIYIADREADMMDMFHAKKEELMHYIIRCQFNRRLDQCDYKLYELIDQQPVAKRFTLRLPHPITRKKRKVKLEMRFCTARIELASRLKCDAHLTPIDVNVVEVKEVDPPANIDKPIHWRLITSLPLDSVDAAAQIVKYYSKRWIIERFHYLLKSGAINIEKRQLEKSHTLKNAIAIYSNAVMEIMKIKYWAEHEPQRNALEVGITKKECRILYAYANKKGISKEQFDPDKPPTIKDFCIVLGQIGGFLPSKRQPLPGMKILARAMIKYETIIEVYEMMERRN